MNIKAIYKLTLVADYGLSNGCLVKGIELKRLYSILLYSLRLFRRPNKSKKLLVWWEVGFSEMSENGAPTARTTRSLFNMRLDVIQLLGYLHVTTGSSEKDSM